MSISPTTLPRRIDGNNDFGPGIDGAGEITRIRRHVVHDDRLAGGYCSATDALRHRYAHVRCGRADERAENQHLGIRRIEHIEAGPTEVRETLRHRCSDSGLQRFERGRHSSQITDVVEETSSNTKSIGES